MLSADWISALILVVTLPLIPIFMALIGLATRAQTDRQFRTLQLLSGHFLDAVAGLTTLKIFGRSKAQIATIGEVTDSYRRRLMTTLRVTFLSSLVLELLASVSVAIIAVAIGLRLLDGHIGLQASLFVLVLAPEAYLPFASSGRNTTPAPKESAPRSRSSQCWRRPRRPMGRVRPTSRPCQDPLARRVGPVHLPGPRTPGDRRT